MDELLKAKKARFEWEKRKSKEEYKYWKPVSNDAWKGAIVRYLDRVDLESINSIDESSVYELTIDHLTEEKVVCVKPIDLGGTEEKINKEMIEGPRSYSNLIEPILIKRMRGRPAGKECDYLVMERAVTSFKNINPSYIGPDPMAMKWFLLGDLLSAIFDLLMLGYVHNNIKDTNAFLVHRFNRYRLTLVLGNFKGAEKADVRFPNYREIHYDALINSIRNVLGETITNTFIDLWSSVYPWDTLGGMITQMTILNLMDMVRRHRW